MDENIIGETTDYPSPLSVDLVSEQVELLAILWQHLAGAGKDPDGPVWPIWHYVDVLYSQSHPSGLTAVEVLESLPHVPRPGQAGNDYGLVWWEEASQSLPLPSSRIGLSVAGLSQLGQNGSNSTSVADALAETISSVAAAQAAVPPNPHLVPTVQRRLSDFLGDGFSATSQRPFAIPEHMIGTLLQREYARLNISQGDGLTVNIMGPDLRPYVAARDAAAYVEVVTKDALDRLEPTKHIAPLPLIQTIDYLSYVLNDDPDWKRMTGRKFAEAPDLASAAALVATSGNRDQFESNIGALWNLVSNFCVPKADPAEMEKVYGKDGARGSLNQLDWWLQQYLDDGGYRRAKYALAEIRAIGKIRNGFAHSSTDKRKVAVEAQKRLGIPSVVTQWSSAWEAVKGALAGALDVLREEVQTRDRGGVG